MVVFNMAKQHISATHDICVFDRERFQSGLSRARKKFEHHNFLHQWSQAQILDRLSDINRDFSNALCIGSRCPVTHAHHQKIKRGVVLDIPPAPVSEFSTPYLCADEEFLPIACQSLDLVVSNLHMHHVNDLPGALVQIRHALKNDGLFLASILGGETLHELRSVMMQAEIDIYGGASPRIAPFADKPQMGDLLQRAGFTLPVVDSDVVRVTYDNALKLMADLRGMGESNCIIARKKEFDRKAFFMRVAELYQERFSEVDGRIVASFEVIFLLGWAPDSSQQKPLRPGSAEHSLADALGSVEIKTGDKARP